MLRIKLEGQNGPDISKLSIREAKAEDLGSISELMQRFIALNGEFDPMLRSREDSEGSIRDYLESAISSDSASIFVAELDGKLVGFLKAEIRSRVFHEPDMEGVIQEFYVLPQFRRRGVGERLVRYAIDRLKERVGLVTAEFPSLNTIAVNFYKKMGFRPIVTRCFKEFSSKPTTYNQATRG